MDDLERDITYRVRYKVITYHEAEVTVTYAEKGAAPATWVAVRRKVALRNDPVLDRFIQLSDFKEVR